MRPARLFCALSLLLACVAALHPGGITLLTLSNFDAQLARGPTLVLVGAQFCGHCARLQPAWQAACASLGGHTACGHIDGPAQRILSTRLGVRGYPSIYLFRDGKMRSYSGLRAEAALVGWARGEYKATAVEPFHRTPNNALGRVTGVLLRLPQRCGALWEHMLKATGVGAGTLAVMTAAALVLGGVAAVASVDFLATVVA